MEQETTNDKEERKKNFEKYCDEFYNIELQSGDCGVFELPFCDI